MDLFGDPRHSISDQVLRAYEYKDKWVNRMVLGDSLVVMNSLLHYEGLGGQVQMIYMDPPYGVKFGSNFQPFVRKRDVTNNEDEDMTREPEMVKAYRDTWELGLHSYLTYMRDRLLLARDLLTPSGSIFVQISDENLHHVRELMDEVFGNENFAATIAYRTSIGMTSSTIDQVFDKVVGWGLRRARYEVGPDGRLSEEIAKVFGVPFEVVPFKASPLGITNPPEKRYHVHALPNRATFEIQFPRIEGYQQAIRNRVIVNWSSLAPVHLDPLRIPPEVEMKAGLPNNQGRYSLAGPGAIAKLDLNPYRKGRRLQELAFELARDLTRDFAGQPQCQAPIHVLFPQIAAIAYRYL
jgi:hypothetical protein